MTESHLDKIVARLAAQTNRPEATTQADIYALLTQADIGLSEETVTMESPIGDGTQRRVDVEIGQCVIEVKKNLHAADLAKAEQQLGGYVKQRTETFGRYVGILTDGSEWRLYRLQGDELEQISTHTLNKKIPHTQALLVWLESVMSTLTAINPVPEQIEHRLGAQSPAHKLDTAELRRIYEAHKDSSEVQLKRQLWAKLLRVALGADFEDSEELFINHTLLVTTAELIAHAVLGFDVGPSGGLTARQITSGTEFANARIRGVVEADFFDWVTDTPAGESFVGNLGRRVARFNWGTVEHDVLKILYESVITKEVRESLGEYYTPDWLADRMVETFVTDPLNSVVADPSCGSGTFLFHAVRRYLAAAKDAGVQVDDAVQQATNHVVGVDVHPVAVTLARVTYLLALGRDNVKSETRKELTIPVYLGDSIQWQQETDIFGGESIRVRTDGTDLFEEQGAMFSLDLHFPRSVVKDATGFDYLVSEMADKALVTDPSNAKKVGLTILKRRGIAADSRDGEILRETFLNLCTLRALGRDHIWGYYVRNLIRPLWLTEPENRVDTLIGNPPWLRYNKMTASMQGRYRALAKPRNLMTGPLGASARDLSTLFVARAIELYLRKGGSFAFVMPHGILTRKPHTGFRSGDWRGDGEGNHLTVRFGESWDLVNADTGFPMTSGVVHGRLSESAGKMPPETLAWSGRLSRPDVPWSIAKKKILVSESSIRALDHGVEISESPYKARFRQGAIIVPKVLLFVAQDTAGPLGAGAGRRSVVSARSNLEKMPWKECSPLKANVEEGFIRPVYLGEQVLPFRTLRPKEAVIPLSDSEILTQEEIELHEGLSTWWSQAEATWEQHRPTNEQKALVERMDYHAQLSSQLPIASTRVVYTASGNTVAAATVRDNRAVIEHNLYWAATMVEAEAHYLNAILNSTPMLSGVKPLQAVGLFGPRHFDKNVFSVPFPTYDNKNPKHIVLAELGKKAEAEAAEVDISDAKTFQAARKLIRTYLVETGTESAIVQEVTELLLSIETQ
ncbi:N-6 DNA methylase [Mycobacteroides abscessus]|uniref:N-6 DNA methylase n=1 Tax=Mycobacteroides abscessus TaxID=36809 RepID=UPI000C2638C5|nr:N-6 DNA methylase [Mycobacteroides abscessus]